MCVVRWKGRGSLQANHHHHGPSNVVWRSWQVPYVTNECVLLQLTSLFVGEMLAEEMSLALFSTSTASTSEVSTGENHLQCYHDIPKDIDPFGILQKRITDEVFTTDSTIDCFQRVRLEGPSQWVMLLCNQSMGCLTDLQQDAVQEIPSYIPQHWAAGRNSDILYCCSSWQGQIQDDL